MRTVVTDDLVTWLRAQLDDDEAHARNAFGDHNDAGPDWHEQWSGALNIGEAEDLVLTNDSQVSRFMAQFDPARVLAEVDAKRRILDAYEQADAPLTELWMSNTTEGGYANGLYAAVRLLALPYADRPGYRDEWRPA